MQLHLLGIKRNWMLLCIDNGFGWSLAWATESFWRTKAGWIEPGGTAGRTQGFDDVTGFGAQSCGKTGFFWSWRRQRLPKGSIRFKICRAQSSLLKPQSSDRLGVPHNHKCCSPVLLFHHISWTAAPFLLLRSQIWWLKSQVLMVELSWMHTFIHVYSIEIDHVFHGKNPSLGSSGLLFVVVFSLFSPRGTRCGTGYPGLLWCQVPMALMEHYWKKRDSFAPRRRGIYRPKYGWFDHDTLGMYLVFWLIDGFFHKGPLFGTVPVPIHSSCHDFPPKSSQIAMDYIKSLLHPMILWFNMNYIPNQSTIGLYPGWIH